mgnify:CR=1 FL=1
MNSLFLLVMKPTSRPISFVSIIIVGLLLVASGCRKEPEYVRPQPLTIEGVPVDDGQLMIFNDPGVYFTFVLRGTSFHNVAGGGRPITLDVDGERIQMTSVAVTEFVPSGSALVSAPEILSRHQAWEVESLARQSGDEELGLYREHVTLEEGGRGCLVWTVDTPGRPTHMLVTTVIGTRVLVLSGLLERLAPSEMVDLLLAAMKTLRRHDHPIDVRWIRDSIAARR